MTLNLVLQQQRSLKSAYVYALPNACYVENIELLLPVNPLSTISCADVEKLVLESGVKIGC